MKMWDLTEPIAGREPANSRQMELIWEFIQEHKDKNIYAHCEAGISRSAAIREYLVRNGWELHDDAQVKRAVFPNIHILNGLTRLDR